MDLSPDFKLVDAFHRLEFNPFQGTPKKTGYIQIVFNENASPSLNYIGVELILLPLSKFQTCRTQAMGRILWNTTLRNLQPV